MAPPSAPNNFETRLSECKTEVEGLIGDVHERLESVEEVHQTIHKTYAAVLGLEQRFSDLSVSFASSEAKRTHLHDALPPEKLRVIDALVYRHTKKGEMYEKLTYKITESGLLGALIFILGIMALGFWQWLQKGMLK